MVSLNSNPLAEGFWLDPMKMGLPGVDSSSSNNAAATTTTVDCANANSNASRELNKKARKPYTITKSRESWTDQEHDKFLEALQLFDRDWKKIEAFVGSKTVIQIRSHAQKYFLKIQKSGKSEHVPPPRPKKKAAYPYPQKASKNALVVSKVTGPFQSSSALPEPGYVLGPDSLLLPGNPITNPTTCYWASHTAALVDASYITKDKVGLSCSGMTQNCCSSSNESTPWMWPSCESNDQEKQQLSQPAKALPDFAKVYSFIASVFDPSASGHLQKLKNMDPINVETVLLLMKNLSVNLTSPEFEDQRKMLLSYGVDAEKAKSSSLCNNLHIYNNAVTSV